MLEKYVTKVIPSMERGMQKNTECHSILWCIASTAWENFGRIAD